MGLSLVRLIIGSLFASEFFSAGWGGGGCLFLGVGERAYFRVEGVTSAFYGIRPWRAS